MTESVKSMATSELQAELKQLTAIKAWRGRYPLIMAELKRRDPRRVELAQDAYYYGTAADFTGNSVTPPEYNDDQQHRTSKEQ